MQQTAMNRAGGVYRFIFDPSVEMRDIEHLLDLSIAAMTALSGEAAVRLGFAYSVAPQHRSVAMEVRSESGMNVAMVFVGLSILAFGGDRVSAERPDANALSLRTNRERNSGPSEKVRLPRSSLSPTPKPPVRGRYGGRACRSVRTPQ